MQRRWPVGKARQSGRIYSLRGLHFAPNSRHNAYVRADKGVSPSKVLLVR
jgi:hypothetical protein